ncbi:programmed cell death protein 2-like [Glandiceps talaboti]
MALLIGVCDEEMPAGTSEVLTPWKFNKIGSHPDWMQCPTPRPVCQLCSQVLYLVVQVYCPLTESVYHRTIYVFTCIAKSCQGKAQSWFVCRSQICDVTDHSQSHQRTTLEENVGMATNDWCDEADDWGEDSETTVSMAIGGETLSEKDGKLKKEEENLNLAKADCKELNGTMQAVERLTLDTPCQVDMQNKCFIGYYINVFEEDDTVNRRDLSRHEKRLLMEYQQREGVDLTDLDMCYPERSQSGGAEKYEKTELKHGDRIFHKFQKRISVCPEQCLRYEWNGEPLLMTANDMHKSIPSCKSCGGQRIFEFQLMPALVSILKIADTSDIPIDFGSVYIYSCKNSCWQENETEKYKEEFFILQPDPDLKFFPNQQQ